MSCFRQRILDMWNYNYFWIQNCKFGERLEDKVRTREVGLDVSPLSFPWNSTLHKFQDGSLLHNKHPAEQWHLNSIFPTSAGKFLLQLNSAGALEPDTRSALCTDTSRCSELRVIVTVLPWYPGGSPVTLRSGVTGQVVSYNARRVFSGWNVTVFEWQSRNASVFIF